MKSFPIAFLVSTILFAGSCISTKVSGQIPDPPKENIHLSVLQGNLDAVKQHIAATPFEADKALYDQLGAGLAPLGLKLDYEQIQTDKPKIGSGKQMDTTLAWQKCMSPRGILPNWV